MKLHFKLRKSADFVYQQLTDMQKFAKIHPVIYKIETTGPNSYRCYERLKMGFIPFSFTYPSTVEGDPVTRNIVIRATVKRMTKIEVKFAITGDTKSCEVEEEVTFRTWLPVKWLMRRIFKTQHQKLFRNMEQANE